jgi:hypothetical protein
LVAEGKFRFYAWGTAPQGVRGFVERGRCPATQFGLNMLTMFFAEAKSAVFAPMDFRSNPVSSAVGVLRLLAGHRPS